MATKKQGIWGWMFFDWASQPFHTLIITFIFAPYFANHVADSSERGQEIWGWTIAGASLAIALLSPFLGAIADQTGPRKPWVAAFSLAYVLGVGALWWMTPGMADPTILLIGFAIGMVGVEFATVFTNSLLPQLGTKEEIGRISGSGWAMGYWGGVVSLVIVLVFFAPGPSGDVTLAQLPPLLGSGEGEGGRVAGPLSAIWYIVFVIPFFLWTPDMQSQSFRSGAVSKGLNQLWTTVKTLPQDKSLFSYLMASMFYRDGLNAVYAFGGIVASGVLGWSITELGIFGIVAAVFGAIGAWFGGLIDQAKGPKPVIVVCMFLMCAIVLFTVSIGPNEVFFVSVGSEEAPSNLPSIAFFVVGAMIGAVGGSLQSASRTMLVRQADPAKLTEAFGIYALSGRATSFLAPAMIAYFTGVTESQRAGMTPVIALFLIGLILMFWVSRNGQSDATT